MLRRKEHLTERDYNVVFNLRQNESGEMYVPCTCPYVMFVMTTVKTLKLLSYKGHSQAQCKLGICYESGDGVEVDPEEAVRWFQLSASKGYMDAQYRLAQAYDNGYGLAKNEVKANRWFCLAANRGHVNAQRTIALRYYTGSGLLEDAEEAVHWFRAGTLRSLTVYCCYK